MRVLHFIMSCGLMLACVTAGAARDVFVNNLIGNDANTGTRAEVHPSGGPVRTLDRALGLVDRGGRVVLAKTDQPYREMIRLCDVRQRGYPDQPLVIQGNGATLDGTVVATPGAWHYENDHIFSLRPRRLTYQQLFRDGTPLDRVRNAGGSSVTLPLKPLEWALLTDRIALRVEEGKLPGQYDLRHAGLQTGITLYNTEYVRIEDLIVQGFQQDGVNAHELVQYCQLVRVECRANGRSGISVGGVSRVSIESCRCYDNGQAQLRVEGQGRATAVDCDFDKRNQAVPWLEMRGGRARAVIDGEEYLKHGP
jgi:hypothetical protein